MRLALVTLGTALLAGLTSCRPSAADSRSPVTGHRSPVIDSILPLEEQLRRFRTGTPDSVTRLSGGAASREALLRRFREAVERGDTVAMLSLAVTRAEFAWLVYPESEFTREPYRQDPALVWFLMRNATDQGLVRLLGRHGGRPFPWDGWRCEESPLRQGPNRLWRECRVRLAEGERRLFGTILEREGVYKFLTYATDY
ncbi:MAG: hypothetical protein ACRENB_06865 [Gemmatimonadales bacterium]